MRMSHTKFLVVDANAFINKINLQDFGINIYTVGSVVAEIKDKATKQRLNVLPYELNIQEPSQKSFVQVLNFSKQSGDAPSLSNADLKIIALTLDLEKDHVGSDHIRPEPLLTQAQKEVAFKQAHSKYVGANSSHASTNDTFGTEASIESKQTSEFTNCDNEDEEFDEADESEDDNDGDWITPDNFDRQAKTGFGLNTIVAETESASPPLVACMTSDFAMQNVLIQMGLKLVGFDGLVIKRPKSFAMWCYCCFATVLKTGVYFCPKCGNDTLHKIPVALQEDGSLKWYFKRDYKFNLRNTIYSIPTPMGGKHAQNPIFVADQPLPQQRAKKTKNNLLNHLDESDWRDLGDDFNPFTMHDLTSRAASLGIQGGKSCRDDRLPLKPTRGPFLRKKKKR